MIIVFSYVIGASVWIFFSDQMLRFLPSTADMVYAATIKGMLFIIVTAIVLYFVLRKYAGGDNEHISAQRKPHYIPLFALAIVAATVAAVTHLAYRTESQAVRDRAVRELHRDVTALSRATSVWLSERISEVNAIAGLPTIRSALDLATVDPTQCLEIARQKARLLRLFSYSGMVVMRSDGHSLCGMPEQESEGGWRVGVGSLFESTTTAQRTAPDGALLLSISVEAPAQGESETRSPARVTVEIRLDETLFPFLRSLVPPEAQAQTLLLRRDGEHYVAFFDSVRSGGSTSADRWSSSELRSSKLIGSDGSGGVGAIAYRSHELIAASESVKGIDWLSVSGFDEGAMSNGLPDFSTTAGASMIIGFGASLVIAFMFWQQQAVRSALVELEQTRRAQSAESLYKATFDAVGVGIVHVGFDGAWIRSNPAFSRISGYTPEQLSQILAFSLIGEDDRDGVRASLGHLAAGSAEALVSERTLICANGQLIPIAITASVVRTEGPAYVVATIEDIRSRRQAETLLLQMESTRRLEALGRMSGGIAHDFNNLLAIISGNLQLLEMYPHSDTAVEWIDAAQRAAEAGASLNRRLVTFARQRRLAATETDIGARASAMAALLVRSLGPNIELHVDAPAEPCLALVDPTEIDNAVLNLSINARDALPDGGSITIETQAVQLQGRVVAGETEPRNGDFVRLRVIDTGVGMAPEVKAKAFDPFFTTKEVGHGTGLGLATLHGFVCQSGGFVSLESEIGRGTTVSMFLPRVTSSRSHGVSEQGANVSPQGKGERLLVVEDNPEVLKVTRERVAALGYVVVEATNAAEALAILASDASFDLVFSDIVMPGGVSGVNLARRVNEEHPNIKILLTTGYSEEIDDPFAHRNREFAILRKPYTQDELSNAIFGALEKTILEFKNT